MSKSITHSKSATVKLSDAQLVMMSAAARRDDRCLAPREGLKGAALRKASEKLIEAGLARELHAKPEMPVWRRDGETAQSYALKLTAAGMRAIAVDEEGEAGSGGKAGHPDHDPRSSLDATPPILSAGSDECPQLENETDEAIASDARTTPSAAPRVGSKLAEVVEMLSQGEGASIAQLIAATDWLPHTTRAALTGLRKRGFAIKRTRESKLTRYRIVDRATQTDPLGEQAGRPPEIGASEIIGDVASAKSASSRKVRVGKRATDRKSGMSAG